MHCSPRGAESLRNQHRLEPDAFLHLGGRPALASSTAARLWHLQRNQHEQFLLSLANDTREAVDAASPPATAERAIDINDSEALCRQCAIRIERTGNRVTVRLRPRE
jgi:hypothetical protein